MILDKYFLLSHNLFRNAFGYEFLSYTNFIDFSTIILTFCRYLVFPGFQW